MFHSGNYRTKGSVIDSAMKKFEKIGSGGYGTVYKVCMYDTLVAIKILHAVSAIAKKNAQCMRAFDTEVTILGKIQHPNLVRLIGACKERLAIVYEFLPNGTLDEKILFRRATFTWRERVKVAFSICDALIFLHSRSEPVAHGDLKPSNILFDASHNVKLGDFGISRILKNTSHSGTKMHVTGGKRVGTRQYTDPEFLMTGQLTSQSDTFAFGVILIQLVTGRFAGIIQSVKSQLSDSGFWKDDDQKNALKKTKVIDETLQISDSEILEVIEMLKIGLDCCNEKRKDRPSLVDIVFPKLKMLNEKTGQCKVPV